VHACTLVANQDFRLQASAFMACFIGTKERWKR